MIPPSAMLKFWPIWFYVSLVYTVIDIVSLYVFLSYSQDSVLLQYPWPGSHKISIYFAIWWLILADRLWSKYPISSWTLHSHSFSAFWLVIHCYITSGCYIKTLQWWGMLAIVSFSLFLKESHEDTDINNNNKKR